MSATQTPVRRRRHERAIDEVVAHPDARDADRRLAALLGPQPGDPGLAHEALDALAAHALAVAEHELGMDARRPIDAAVGGVDLADALE